MFPTPGDPALVEHERLDRGAAPARLLAQVGGGELGRERLDPEPRGEVRIARGVAVQQVAGPEPARVDVDEPVAAVELEAHAGVRRLGGGSNSSAPVIRRCISRWRSSDSSQSRYLPKRRHPLHDGAAQPLLHELGELGPGPAKSRISTSTIVRPSRCGASWRRIVSTSGSSGISD